MIVNERTVNLLEIDFYSILDVGYDLEYNCESYGCDSEGICRCGTMTDVKLVDDIDLTIITDHIYNKIFNITNDIATKREHIINSILGDYDINKYFINRLLTLYKVYDKECWNIDYGKGYYGDEIDGVFIDVENTINTDLDILLLDNKTKIEFLLIKEYGYLDERLISKRWTLDIINKSDIIFGQKEHYDNVHQGLMYYNDTVYDNDLPRGIFRKDGDKYRIVDGYHRVKNTREDFVIALIAY